MSLCGVYVSVDPAGSLPCLIHVILHSYRLTAFKTSTLQFSLRGSEVGFQPIRLTIASLQATVRRQIWLALLRVIVALLMLVRGGAGAIPTQPTKGKGQGSRHHPASTAVRAFMTNTHPQAR